MTPACSLIIIKTRELLMATPCEVLARIHIYVMDSGLENSPEDSSIHKKLRLLRDHANGLNPTELAKEYIGMFEAISTLATKATLTINPHTGTPFFVTTADDERIIVDHCKFVAQSIMECDKYIKAGN